jgi:hypothetical protein
LRSALVLEKLRLKEIKFAARSLLASVHPITAPSHYYCS